MRHAWERAFGWRTAAYMQGQRLGSPLYGGDTLPKRFGTQSGFDGCAPPRSVRQHGLRTPISSSAPHQYTKTGTYRSRPTDIIRSRTLYERRWRHTDRRLYCGVPLSSPDAPTRPVKLRRGSGSSASSRQVHAHRGGDGVGQRGPPRRACRSIRSIERRLPN